MKGFVISYFYPPINSSEGLVTFKLLKNSQYEYDVFTQNRPISWSYGNQEKELTSKNVRTIFSEKSKIKDWPKEAVKFFEEHKDNYDFIMSRSMPPESHAAALQIKKAHPEVKWIASFGDPIADNPYTYSNETEENPYKIRGKSLQNVSLRFMLSPKRIIKSSLKGLLNKRHAKGGQKYQNQILKEQQEILDYADQIIFNNSFQQEHMLKTTKHPDKIRKKSIVIPHSFDKDLYPKTAKPKNKKITFSYLGHLDDARNIQPFLLALKQLRKEDPKLASKIQLNVYGTMGAQDKVTLVDNWLFDIVQIKKPVKYLESLKIMHDSDWLLLVDANLSDFIDHNIFFAAKTADYLGAGSNIFGITMENGASADILRQTDSILSTYSVNEVVMHLKSILNNANHHKTTNQSDYDVVNVVKPYDKMVKKLVKGA